ncbi:hypothetical protein UA08_02610 [Talaromyces atroroseus]|uniref:Uncharacterized protein n=1 Tax=Talaromyces atroroseus TaxID=1441469 RepID=A0A225AU75_TALAT|nr:hypothetical protein UA08_02610 [Talaromyces atroroseus]OKL61914.1 hypothetical protein UA08_02610 [Talaromyces atroroseus]
MYPFAPSRLPELGIQLYPVDFEPCRQMPDLAWPIEHPGAWLLAFCFGLRRQIFFPLLGDGIFTQDGAAWKHSRELLRPQFTRQQYQGLDIFREHVNDLIALIPKDGQPVDLQPLFFQLTLDTTTELIFGASINTLKKEEGISRTKDFAENFDTAQNFVVQRFRLLDLYWLIGGQKFQRSCATVHDFVDDIIENSQREAQKDSRKASRYLFFNTIAQKYNDKKAVRDQLVNVLLAGRDTTACLLTWTFHLLAQHQRVLKCLLDEISHTVGQRDGLTREDLKKMPYLANILKETLRLYPSVPVNTRTAHRTTILPTGGGPDGLSPVIIRKGENVAFCIYAMHRREDLYGKDAEEFRPERWEENLPLFKDETTASWGYLPFNGGPRVCLGQDFALIEASYTIVRILQAFPNLRAAPDSGHETQMSKQQTVGITELYRCQGKTPEIDIVAVHGLNGDAFETWTSSSNDSERVCWLNHPDLLPHFVGNARVLTWGYNANITSLFGKSTSSDRILQHAQTLVEDLLADRELEDATDRPIVFVCHSLGGIIVKRALSFSASRSSPRSARLHSLYLCTYGILFFGTPHNGSSKARLLDGLQKLASNIVPKRAIQFESGLIKALKDGSETLQNITNDFAPLMSRFHMYFFWEQLKTDLKYTKDYIVEESSAAPMLDSISGRCGISADHRGMCKFQSPDSPGFRTAIAAIKRYAQNAPSIIGPRLAQYQVQSTQLRKDEAMELLNSI